MERERSLWTEWPAGLAQWKMARGEMGHSEKICWGGEGRGLIGASNASPVLWLSLGFR